MLSITTFIILTTLALTGCGNSAAPKSSGRNTNIIYSAIENNQLETLKVLIKSGADLNRKEINGRTPLHYAAFYGRTEAVNLLVIEGHAEVNPVDLEGETPLFYGARSGKIEVVKILLKNGANPKITNKYGKTALEYTTDKTIESLLAPETAP